MKTFYTTMQIIMFYLSKGFEYLSKVSKEASIYFYEKAGVIL